MDLKIKTARRVGGSLMVAVDPDFAREAGIEDGTDIYMVADKKFVVLTRDKKEAEAINDELHAHTRKFLRSRIASVEQEAADE